MYGEGLISDEIFKSLRLLADGGKLRSIDLAVHRAKGSRHASRKADSELQNALHGVQSRLTQLAETRAYSAKVLKDLENRSDNIDKVVAIKKQNARQAISENNEDMARLNLTEKTDLIESQSRLAAQAQSLREDLARLDHLRTQLETKVVELEVVRSREDIANIKGL